jgi:diguanylate cyclase (GGDEF)-like protein
MTLIDVHHDAQAPTVFEVLWLALPPTLLPEGYAAQRDRLWQQLQSGGTPLCHIDVSDNLLDAWGKILSRQGHPNAYHLVYIEHAPTAAGQSQGNAFAHCRVLKQHDDFCQLPVVVGLFDEKIPIPEGFQSKADTLFFWHRPLPPLSFPDVLQATDTALPSEACKTNPVALETQRQQRFLETLETLNSLFARLRQRASNTPPADQEEPPPASIAQQQIMFEYQQQLLAQDIVQEFRGLSEWVHDLNLLGHMLFSLIEALVPYPVCALYVAEPKGSIPSLLVHIREGVQLSSPDVITLQTLCFQKLAEESHTVDTVQLEIIGPQPTGSGTTGNEAGLAWEETPYCLPVIMNGKLLGALFGLRPADHPAPGPTASAGANPPDVLPVVEQVLGQELCILMQLRQAWSQTQAARLHDELSGLITFRQFLGVLEREMKRARRYELPLSLCVVDLVGFRRINERFGYLAGDSVIRHVSDLIQQSLRSVDMVSRISADQWALMLPDTNTDSARIACNRIQRLVANRPLIWQDTPITLDLKYGLSLYNEEDMANAEQLMGAASQFLRQARAQVA